jgi:5-methyltetrahydrofolate--homocysteine methyltransferase
VTDNEALRRAIEEGDRSAAVEHTRQALADGVEPSVLLDEMSDVLRVVGLKFQNNEIFVPEMLIAARAMKAATAILEPLLVGAGAMSAPVAVIGTVSGDLHDIGKNLVAMMWKGAGFQVVDLGVNVPADRFVQAAREHDARLVGVSALLTTTMVGMREVVAAIRDANLPDTKVMVGGAPVTEAFAREIGADGYSADAASAADAARRLVLGRTPS